MEGGERMYTILVCDDDEDIRRALRIYLSGEDYAVVEARDGAEALKMLDEWEIHLVLMDIMMPILDGVAATERLRERWNVPVIFITAKSEDTDKILGLTAGADDYVTKPFNPLEVIARVRAQLRRYARLGGMPGMESRPPEKTALSFGGIEMDDEAKRVTLNGDEVALTPTEYDILRLLLQNPGKVFPTREIYRRVWGEEPIGAEGAVAVHIRHLREKLEIDPAEPRLLKVVWGQGYKLEDKP